MGLLKVELNFDWWMTLLKFTVGACCPLFFIIFFWNQIFRVLLRQYIHEIQDNPCMFTFFFFILHYFFSLYCITCYWILREKQDSYGIISGSVFNHFLGFFFTRKKAFTVCCMWTWLISFWCLFTNINIWKN